MVLRRSHIILITLLCVATLLSACNRNKSTGKVVTTDKAPVEDKEAPYIEGNKAIMRWEDEEMSLFIKRYEWDMERTGTGLYVQILAPGHGDTFQEGDEVSLKYQITMLNGEPLYDSTHDGIKTFKVARSEELEALHEVAPMLRHGSRARLVIPSYLAYGVSGDGNRVRGRMPIAMTLEVLE